MKSSNRAKAEYINELPANVFEIKYYNNFYNSQFDRYWIDMNKCQVIMKDKRCNKYKVVHPMINKIDNTRFIHMYDINNNQIFVNYDYLIYSYSIGYYLNHLI